MDPFEAHGWCNRDNRIFAAVRHDAIDETAGPDEVVLLWARAHVHDIASVGDPARLSRETFQAAVAAWLGGMWQLACEIVVAACGGDLDAVVESKRPKLQFDTSSTVRMYINGLVRRDVQ